VNEEKHMKTQTPQKKFMPEISQKEMDDLKATVTAASQKIIADNIERMKKADPHRPEAMKYFDEISNLFGKRQAEIAAEKAKGKKVIGYMCLFAPTELIILPNAEFGGADGNAAQEIEDSGYEPWITPLWEPPSGEIESLLFSVQAAIGAVIIGYFVGYERGKRAQLKNKKTPKE